MEPIQKNGLAIQPIYPRAERTFSTQTQGKLRVDLRGTARFLKYAKMNGYLHSAKPCFNSLPKVIQTLISHFAVSEMPSKQFSWIDLAFFQINKTMRAHRIDSLNCNHKMVSILLKKAFQKGGQNRIPEHIIRELQRVGKSIKSLDLSGIKEISLENMELFTKLFPNLETLNLTRVSVTDAILHSLAQLKNLNSIDLSHCSAISDTGCQHIASFQNLRSLTLAWCCEITDVGVEHIMTLTNLQNLNLEGSWTLTGKGFRNIGQLQYLEHLRLNCCNKIGDLGLQYISQVQNLKSLEIEGFFEVSNSGFQSLTSLKNLNSLKMHCCYKITDSALECLLELPNLHYLDLANNFQLSSTAKSSLALRLPTCQVRVEGS